MFNNKTILITGGTGSLGKECVRLLLKKYNPNKIIIYSRDETKQYKMAKLFNSSLLTYIIGDVRDRLRVIEAMYSVDFVLHTAALKHIPTTEYNPIESIKTNIDGTQNVIEAAIVNKVKKVIYLSTDKASNPVNIYGTTKLTAEKLIITANNNPKSNTQFSVIRYGNILGTKGNLIPFFIKLTKGGVTHLPITDENMTRFIITLDAAAKFIFKSFERMQGAEIFIPKLASTKIINLAKALCPKCKFTITGKNLGEKLHETMITPNDNIVEFTSYYIITPNIELTKKIDFTKNSLNEKGKKVKNGIEYNSSNNKILLKKKELSKLIEKFL